MLTKAIIKKWLVVLLLLSFLNSILTPNIAFALTSGPENPEATSFEPVDTTDMVNLLTGDLAYNIPLLEVPGPEGGYPLSLSYHAGIMPEEEASWAGLGWTINPGSISRTVSGFPDDFSGQQSVVRDYWNGGHTSTTTVGVNVGITGVLSADFGISISKDTYLGTGIGGYVGLQGGLRNTNVKGSLGLAVEPFGGLSVYGGIGIGINLSSKPIGGMSPSLGVNLGFSINSSGLNVGAGAGISLGKYRGEKFKDSPYSSTGGSLLGVSINSAGGGASMSVAGGYTNVESANVGKIQTQSRSWGITIPILWWGSISLKRNYLRYWSDATTAVSTFGTLHYPEQKSTGQWNNEYDTYYIADINDPTYSLLYKQDPIKSTGGTFPDYDTYSVLGQGVSGYMRPFGYQLEVVGKGKNVTGMTTNRQRTEYRESIVCDVNPYTGEDTNCGPVTYEEIYTNNPKLNFRFINDFSNRYLQSAPYLSTGASTFNFDLNPTYGENDGTFGFDQSLERTASSKNIEYFTNYEIKNGTARSKGFVDTQAPGFDRAKDPNGNAIYEGSTIYDKDNRIGGFMITNESGVTYHYALPVYAYEEFTKTENISGVNQYNTQSRAKPYATSWLLTSVTGPDYVDINNNGLADQGDWGYWVDMAYGRWTSAYTWRNPGVGFKVDLDTRFKYHSRGKKEIYYLDAIKTASHTALFEKQIRADGKSTTNDQGGFDGDPISLLRLNSIILFQNGDINNLSLTSLRQASYVYSHGLQQNSAVIEKADIDNLPEIKDKVLRRIALNYDYTLCPRTPNSFDEQGQIYSTSGINTAMLPRLGKLTLKEVTFLGKKGEASIPPTEFEYETPNELLKQSNSVQFTGIKPNTSIYQFQLNGVSTNDPTTAFTEGDLIKFNHNQFDFYGLIKHVTDTPLGGGTVDRKMEVKFMGNGPVLSTGTDLYSWTTTKNPPYSSDCYDVWGLFKADFQGVQGNENLSRLPSRSSARSVDVWSLRRVKHPLGMTTDIIYEPDVYSDVALYRNASIPVTSVQKGDNFKFTIFSNAVNTGLDFRDFMHAGDKVRLFLSGNYQNVVGDDQYGSSTVVNQDVSISSGDEPSLLVTSVSDNSVEIMNEQFYNEIFNNQNGPTTNFYGGNLSAGGIGNNFGGGLRVSKVINNEPITGVKMAVKYDYSKPQNPALSSGTTSYEPIGIDAVELRSGGNTVAYQDEINKGFSKLLGLAREIPAPGVMYQFVTVSSERTAEGITTQQIGSSRYQFEVFTTGMVGVWNENATRNSNSDISNIILQNNCSRVGNLKQMTTYDAQGHPLSKLINNYLHDEEVGNSAEANRRQYDGLLARYNAQGVFSERTAESRYNDGKTRRVSSLRVSYPTVLTGTTTIDFVTGQKIQSQTLGFDFYSGQPNKVLTIDAYGNRFIDQTRSAYRKYPQMGLRSMDVTRPNMLTQNASTTLYKVDAQNNYTAVVSSSATIWDQSVAVVTDQGQSIQQSVWRPHYTYQWLPVSRSGGFTPINEYAAFNTLVSPGGAWTNTSEIGLYSTYSNPLEAKDINGLYRATKMSRDLSKVYVSASNSNYHEMTYGGLEDGVIGGGQLPRGMTLGDATLSTIYAHTGRVSARLTAGQSGLCYSVNSSKLRQGKSYLASVWVRTHGSLENVHLYYQVNGGGRFNVQPRTDRKAGQWYLMTLQIPANAISGNITVGCSTDNADAFFDDLRFKPIGSSMLSYVYDLSSGELSYLLDDNNLFSHFEYDSQGRLIRTYKESFMYGVRPVSETEYNYASSTSAKWFPNGTSRCQTVNGATTGLQESQQVDLNILSPTYNQVRWVVTGSSSECGANPSNCNTADRKYINGNCETGFKYYTRSISQGSGFQCFYVFRFSDGSQSIEFEEYSPSSCTDTHISY